MAEDDVHRVNRVGADGLLQVCRLRGSVSSQNVVKQVPADQRHELDGDLKRAVLPTVPRQGDVQIHLRSQRRVRRSPQLLGGEERPVADPSGLTPPEATGSAFTV